MANEYILKSFDGGAQTTTLTSGFTAGAGTLTVANGTSFPDGSAGKFVVVVDRGLATEEKFLITSTSGASNVTFTISNAGYDGTSAINHNVGATVDHCLDAYTVEQANRYVNLQTTKGSLVTHTGTTSTALTASATNNLTLLTDSTAGSGIKWAQLPTAGIVDAAVTDAKIATGVALSKLAAGDTNRGNTGTFYLKTHDLGSASGAATFSGNALTTYLSGNSASAYVALDYTAITALQDGTGQGIGMYFHDTQPGFLLGARDFSGLITLVYN